MPIVQTSTRLKSAQVKKDLYLTDVSEDPNGKGLYRVLAVLERNVELEDCSSPDGLPQWLGVSELCERMRLVRPSA